MKSIRAGFGLLVVVTIFTIVISMVIPSTTSNVYAQDISTATPTVQVVAETAIAVSESPVPNTPVPVGYGIYDERVSNIVYTGSWVSQKVTGNYLNTEKYSNVVGSTAQFTFTGEILTIIYRGYPNVFGNMEVKIDGIYVGTITQTTSKQKFQKRWTSGNLSVGTHTLTLTHLTGTYVSLDGFIVSKPQTVNPAEASTPVPTDTILLSPTVAPLPLVGYGTYDERTPEIVYNGSWVAQNVTGNYLNTEKYSTVKGSSANFTFTGETINVIYRGYPNVFGNMEVKIDGTYVGTINQTTSQQTLQNRWRSGNLTVGIHTLTLTHLTGTFVSLDGIIVSGQQSTPTASKTISPTYTKTSIPTFIPNPSLGYGTYDERIPDIVYTGSWYEKSVTGNYLNTEKFSYMIGSSAKITFTGENVKIIYRGYPTVFGNMEVKIDGTYVGTINQTTSVQTLQNQWISGSLSTGTHVLILKHLTGKYVSLDGIVVNKSYATPVSTLPLPTNVPTATATPISTNAPVLTSTTNPYSTPALPTSTPTNTSALLTPTRASTPTATSSNVQYVDGRIGVDTNPGTLSQPWKTIQKCLELVQPGGTCEINSGTYYESLVLKHSGTQANPISLLANGLVTVDSGNLRSLVTNGQIGYYRIERFRFISTLIADDTVSFGYNYWGDGHTAERGNDGFSLRNCYVEGGIYFYGSDNLVENCELNGRGLIVNGITERSQPSENNTFRNNSIHDYTRRGGWSLQMTDNTSWESNTFYNIAKTGGGAGIDCDGAGIPVHRCNIKNNLFYNNGATSAIEMENAFDSIVENNTIHDGKTGVHVINYNIENGDGFHSDNNYKGLMTNTIIRNNIIYNMSNDGILCHAVRGNQVLNNTIYNVKATPGYYGAIGMASYTNITCLDWVVKNNLVSQSPKTIALLGNPFVNINNNFYEVFSANIINSGVKSFLQWQALGKDVNSVMGNPLFVNPVLGDFHLQPNSPACTAGENGEYVGAIPCD